MPWSCGDQGRVVRKDVAVELPLGLGLEGGVGFPQLHRGGVSISG